MESGRESFKNKLLSLGTKNFEDIKPLSDAIRCDYALFPFFKEKREKKEKEEENKTLEHMHTNHHKAPKQTFLGLLSTNGRVTFMQFPPLQVHNYLLRPLVLLVDARVFVDPAQDLLMPDKTILWLQNPLFASKSEPGQHQNFKAFHFRCPWTVELS